MLHLGSGPVDSQPASQTHLVTPLRGFLLIVGTAAALAVPLQAQDTYSLSGRVIEEGTSNGIPGATVEIENREILGTGSTGPDGGFLFEGIEPGGYTVRVAALGYSPVSLYVVADEDTALEISLSISPIPLDSLAVDARSVDIGGRVVDESAGLALVGAAVLTDQGRATATDGNGRFELEGVLADIPLLVVVRAFGYQPLAATVVPAEDGEYEFELERDPAVQRAIDVEVERIEERASRYPSVLRSVGSERLESLAELTLGDALRVENGSLLERVRCAVLDERQVASRWMVDVLLSTTVPQEVERVEFLSAPADPDFVMMRVYTRDFIRKMIASDVELRRPTFMQPSTGRADVDLRGDYRTFQPPPRILENRSDEPPAPLCG